MNSPSKLPQTIEWTLGDSPLVSSGLVCAIGNFDGVHKGHQAVIATAHECAAQTGLPLAVITFLPHPRQYFRPSDLPFLLQNTVNKNKCLVALGVKCVIHVRFDKGLQELPPETFVETVLINSFQATHLYAGADFAFGKGRAGSMSSLAQTGKPFGLAVHPVDICKDDGQVAISSTRIRSALQSGQVELARDMLGRAHCISGQVVMGDQRGRLLDFPTANLYLGDCLEPAFGVYAVTVTIEDHDGRVRSVKGVANIGRRPTVNDRGVLVETHIFDFEEDIYGCDLTIELQAFLRREKKFNGLDELRAQIAKDAEQAKQGLR